MTDTAPYGVIDYMGYGAVVVFEDGVPRIVHEGPDAWVVAGELNS